MWDRVNKIKTWQVAMVLLIVGFAAYSTGLHSSFKGDDLTQIVDNPVTHSISHFPLLFEGSTSYNGHGIAPLTGIYYRPMMMVVYSLIYTFFGAHTIYYHLVQLLLTIAGAFLLYLILRYTFKSLPSLVLALIFLLHPLNSQVTFSIPAMQDVLMFFFGMLAFWLLLRFQSKKILIPVALCLFLTLLSKEMGLAFLLLPTMYLFWFNRERLLYFIGAMVLPIAAYLILKIHAVGVAAHANVAPIDHAGIAARLLTIPATIELYITKVIFPWKLSAGGYYWVYRDFSVRHVLLPLIIDLATIALFVYLGHRVHKNLSKAQFYTYIFFAFWVIVGTLPYLQLLSLDMTANDGWFHIALVGVLGMLGVASKTFSVSKNQAWAVAVALILITTGLGVRTFFRGLEWSGDAVALARQDIASGSENYHAYSAIGQSYINNANYDQAKVYVQKSIQLFPSYFAYYQLGNIELYQQNYPAAVDAFKTGMNSGQYYGLYEGLAALTIFYSKDPQGSQDYLTGALEKFPNDSTIWLYLAILEYRGHNPAVAKAAISKAAQYGPIPVQVYNGIATNAPFEMNYYGRIIKISQ